MWREQMRLNAADTPVKREHWDLQTDFVSDLASFPLIKATTFMLQF